MMAAVEDFSAEAGDFFPEVFSAVAEEAVSRLDSAASEVGNPVSGRPSEVLNFLSGSFLDLDFEPKPYNSKMSSSWDSR